MPAICVMPAGNIVLSCSVAGMASSYRRPAPTLGQFVQIYTPENCVFKASKASVGAGHARDVCLCLQVNSAKLFGRRHGQLVQ